MSVDLVAGSERIVRQLDIGELVYEHQPAGTWLTAKGEPAKKDRRRYLLDDREFPTSVSQLVGCLEKPALYSWYEDHGCRGGVKAERLGELQDVPEEEWVRRVRLLKLGADTQRDQGADRGTVLHDALRTLAVEGRAPNPAEFPAIARPWVQGAIRAWLALNPETVEAEGIVCHPELDYAGRFDLIARVEGAPALLDYKSSAKGRVYDSAHWTTRLYQMAATRCGIEVERIILVGIGDDGGFELIDCAASEADARALVHTFHAQRQINAAMADQRKIARAAAKAAA